MSQALKYDVIIHHKRTAWGCKGCGRIPNTEKLEIIWAKFLTFEQSIQLNSCVSEVVSIFPNKVKQKIDK